MQQSHISPTRMDAGGAGPVYEEREVADAVFKMGCGSGEDRRRHIPVQQLQPGIVIEDTQARNDVPFSGAISTPYASWQKCSRHEATRSDSGNSSVERLTTTRLLAFNTKSPNMKIAISRLARIANGKGVLVPRL